MTDTHVPDVSKWQGSVDFSKVGPAIILRAHSGLSADPTFASRQVLARKHCLVRGYYLFLVKGRDAATQGREFAQVVGKLQPGEFAVVDAEEGDGDQSARVEACADAIDAGCGGKAWVYASVSFRASHLTRVTGRRWWIAAYRDTEPAGDHVLWQHTDREQHPGIGPCDCSVFHGSVQQLRDLISPPAVKTQAAAQPTPLPGRLLYPFPLPTGHVFHTGVQHKALGVVYRYFNLPTPADYVMTQQLADKVAAFRRTHQIPGTAVIDFAVWRALFTQP